MVNRGALIRRIVAVLLTLTLVFGSTSDLFTGIARVLAEESTQVSDSAPEFPDEADPLPGDDDTLPDEDVTPDEDVSPDEDETPVNLELLFEYVNAKR